MSKSRKIRCTPHDRHLAPWVVLKREQVFAATPWIRIERQQVALPDGRTIDDYYRILLADYAIIFAQTVEGMVVVERHYKHGPGSVGYSLPAGAVEEGEDPLTAARRELLEETGYDAPDWRPLGRFAVNGNYGCGNAYLFYAGNACKVTEPDSGDLEDTEVLCMSHAELLEAVQRGMVPLLGTVAAIALVGQLLGKPG